MNNNFHNYLINRPDEIDRVKKKQFSQKDELIKKYSAVPPGAQSRGFWSPTKLNS